MGILNMHRVHRHEEGVSLIETLIALLILSFVSISTLAMFSQGMRLNKAGADYSSITNIAKDKLEEMLSLPYSHADLAQASTPVEDPNPPSPQFRITWRVAEHEIIEGSTEPADVFSGDVMTSTASAPNAGNLKVIAVTVIALGDYAAGRRTVTVQGMMIKKGT